MTKIYVVIEVPFTGGEPQEEFRTPWEAEDFIELVRQGRNPLGSNRPYEHDADDLAIVEQERPED
jgi:hypothetical protein